MQLHFFAEFTILHECKLAFTFCIHVNLIPRGGVILVFTDGAD